MFVLLSKDKEKIKTVTPLSRDIFQQRLCDREHEFMKNAVLTERKINSYTKKL